MIQALFYIPTIFSLLLLAILVFRKNPKNIVNRIFSAFVATTSIWLVLLYLQDISNNPERALLIVRLVSAIDALLAYLFLVFTFHFPTRIVIRKWLNALVLLPPLYFIFTSFSPANIAGVDVSGIVAIPTKTGFILDLYLLYNVGYFLLAFGILISKLKYATIPRKYQIKAVLLATLFTVLVNVVYIKLYFFINPNSLWQLMYVPTILVSVLIMTPPVLGRRIFDIRSLLANSVVYVADYLRKRNSTAGLYEIQTLVYELESNHIALDFTGVNEIEPKAISFFVDLKQKMKSKKKHLYFINIPRSKNHLKKPNPFTNTSNA